MKLKHLLNKKGQLASLQSIPVFIVILIIAATILVLGIIVLQEIRDTQITGFVAADNQSGNCTVGSTDGCGEAFSGANLTVVGLGTFADFWTIIVLALVITVVLGLLLSMFGGRRIR